VAHKRPTGSKEPVPAGTEADAVLCHGHGQYSLCAPPFVYFARIARRHVERFGVNQGRIVVVCEPKQRSHTTVKRPARFEIRSQNPTHSAKFQS
jgi:hypothetical protein